MIVKEYKALPSPIYGGDLYFQLGATNHVKYGGNPLESSSINGQLPAYFVTYSFLSGNIARILNISALQAEIILSYLTIILSAIIIYILINKLFKNKYLAVACALMYNIPINLVFKYTNLGHQLIILIFLLTIYNFLEKESFKNAILLGVAYGVTGLTHSILFISATFLLGIMLTYYFITRNKQYMQNKEYKHIIENASKYALIILIGVAIALLWWFKPVFYYHGATSLNYNEALLPNFSKLSVQLSNIKIMFSELVNFSSIILIIHTLLVIAGIFFIFITKNNPEKKFITVLFISSILVNLHFLITYNLFSVHFSPSYMTYLLVSPATLLIVAFGIYTASHQIKNRKYVTLSLIALILVLIIVSIPVTLKSNDNQWAQSAKAGLPEYMSGLETYLVKNTNVYDTILSTNEISFAVNGISGRKVMVSRRAQTDPFMDMDRRQIDAAIILYGNNTEKKLELLKKYDVKYIYWDYYWLQSEFQFDNSGKVIGMFDPLLIFKEYKSYTDLDLYGVKYIQDNTWVDPTLRDESVKKFDVVIVSPQNYDNVTNPWKSDLNQYLEEVWSYNQSGQKIAALYKVI